MSEAFTSRVRRALARDAGRVVEGLRRHAGGRCAVCRAWCGEALCAHCDARFVARHARCAGCGMPRAAPPHDTHCLECRRHPPPWQRVVAGVDYAYPWAALIAAFKFSQRVELARVLCLPLERRLAGEPHPERLAGLRLVPVPLARDRLRERGYNQAWEITRRLAATLGCETDSRLLLRIRDTPHQLAFPPERRAGNVRSAFAVEPRRLGELRGRRVTVVDDVMTTGATAGEIARTLLQAGAAEVEVWAIARTPRPGDD